VRECVLRSVCCIGDSVYMVAMRSCNPVSDCLSLYCLSTSCCVADVT